MKKCNDYQKFFVIQKLVFDVGLLLISVGVLIPFLVPVIKGNMLIYVVAAVLIILGIFMTLYLPKTIDAKLDKIRKDCISELLEEEFPAEIEASDEIVVTRFNLYFDILLSLVSKNMEYAKKYVMEKLSACKHAYLKRNYLFTTIYFVGKEDEVKEEIRSFVRDVFESN